MEHIFRGEVISHSELDFYMDKLEETLAKDLLLEPLEADVLIQALNQLIEEIDFVNLSELLENEGMPLWQSKLYIDYIVTSLSEESLYKRIERELGVEPFQWREIEKGIEERDYPYGVLFHIGAGNAVALSVMSVIEGLLTRNINILKIPSYENGISSMILKKLIKIEERLKPYIYVFDIPSTEIEQLQYLAGMSNGMIVWGSDIAISSARNFAPTSLPIIEWGHKISFAYCTDIFEEDIKNLAKEICFTEQQFCSSPQCVFLETNHCEELEMFGELLSKYLGVYSQQYTRDDLHYAHQSEITLTIESAKMEEVLGEKKVIEGKNKDYNILIDYQPSLKASPLYRNVWIMPIKREEVIAILGPYKGYLQTVGLRADENSLEELSHLFYLSGVNRITKLGQMTQSYSGEPHDGMSTLRRYTRRVSRKLG